MERSDWFDRFRQEWHAYPSQDNEGYIPHRGGFKTGFHCAWNIVFDELERLKAKLESFGDKYHRASERYEEMKQALEFYASCPSGLGMIEGTMNGGEFIPLGTRARECLARIKKAEAGEGSSE